MIDYYEDTASCMTGTRPQENTDNRRSISFSISLQILAHEGFSVKGDMHMSKSGAAIPARASKLVASPVTADIEQEYDDTSITAMPRSAVRFRSTTQPQEPQKPCTTDDLTLPPTRRTDNLRFWLWVFGVLLAAILFNNIVIPTINDALTQWHYGDARIIPFDINGHHFITEENNGRVRIVISSTDGTKNQVLVQRVSGASDHSLVVLYPDGAKIDVIVNGTYLARLDPDGNGGYQWEAN